MSKIDLAAILSAALYIALFLMATAAAARKAGRTLWLFGAGSEPQTLPAMLFRLSFAGALLWPLVQLAGYAPSTDDPIRRYLDGSLGDAIGLPLVIGGAFVAFASQVYMGLSWRIGAATGEVGTIVESGPFAYSRNPVFVGQILLFIGLFLVMPSVVQGMLAIAMTIAAVLQVQIEERVLTKSLGQAYADYRTRVPRWL